jgi:hypothetical protein
MYSNSVEIYNIKLKEKSYSIHTSLEMMGHRSDIRFVTLSYDDELLISASSGNFFFPITKTVMLI